MFYTYKGIAMEAKLTLKLDKRIIDSAKIYARKHNRSLSKLVENYFSHLSRGQAIPKSIRRSWKVFPAFCPRTIWNGLPWKTSGPRTS